MGTQGQQTRQGQRRRRGKGSNQDPGSPAAYVGLPCVDRGRGLRSARAGEAPPSLSYALTLRAAPPSGRPPAAARGPSRGRRAFLRPAAGPRGPPRVPLRLVKKAHPSPFTRVHREENERALLLLRRGGPRLLVLRWTRALFGLPWPARAL